jgi:hypothetical protein
MYLKMINLTRILLEFVTQGEASLDACGRSAWLQLYSRLTVVVRHPHLAPADEPQQDLAQLVASLAPTLADRSQIIKFFPNEYFSKQRTTGVKSFQVRLLAIPNLNMQTFPVDPSHPTGEPVNPPQEPRPRKFTGKQTVHRSAHEVFISHEAGKAISHRESSLISPTIRLGL